MLNTLIGQKDLSNYSFLVTGAAGFIGSNLVEELLANKAGKVIGLDNLSTGSLANIEDFFSNPAFEFIEGDITDLNTCLSACKGIDIIFHQAALGSVPRSIKDPISTNLTNVNGFLNIIYAAKEMQVKRFIYAASSSTYGDSKELPKKEDRIGKPLSPYAVTKLVNELYADVFAKTYHMETIGLRYFNVYGPKQNPSGAYAAVIPKFIQCMISDTSPLIDGDGEQTRDFTFVSNVVQANIKAAFTTNPDAINQVYNIAVGERHSIKDLFRILNEISGKNLVSQFLPPRLGDVRDSHADISKARSLLNYEPTIRFKEGLSKTFNWYKDNYEIIKK